ncbi:carbohydrate esterase family 14 protein [Mycena alexandri]|uniref:N-acetylglucosaminylphosphatidylinositol deacetylase n=1 Tax=Mycena alexandri TaxID=1745969 RepID=A0AAD6XAD1_9AGAR|nr:carbohydrate esterase family 14 protein [Mycena alexandri]
MRISFTAGSLRQPVKVARQLDSSGSNAFAGNILLLTAHPDDECMFFAPTILALAALQQPAISNRNPRSSLETQAGLGAIRKYELESSLDLLGVDTDKRLLVDHPYWDAQIIASILTFDGQGVSGHPNHKSLPFGAKELISTLKEVRLYTADNNPAAHKIYGHSGPVVGQIRPLREQPAAPLGGTTDAITGQAMPVFVSGIKEYWAALQAMRAHPSQLEWFRWLYVIFSRYMWVNEWNEVKVV